MDLKEFVTATIVQIQEGVQEAINRRSITAGASGVINPVWGDSKDIGAAHAQKVEFDVAVTVADTTSSGGGSIKVFSIDSADVETTRTAEQSKISRAKFSIPIVPPVQLVKPE